MVFRCDLKFTKKRQNYDIGGVKMRGYSMINRTMRTAWGARGHGVQQGRACTP